MRAIRNSQSGLASKLHLTAIATVSAAMVVSLLSGGCSIFSDARTQKTDVMNHYSAGDYPKAKALVSEKSEGSSGGRDELMWLLEDGVVEFSAGNYDESLKSLDLAEAIVEDYENRAEINFRSIAAEVGAAFTNPSVIPYYGSSYEKILIHFYKALDYYAIGEPEAALVELNRARYRQKMAVRDFDEEIINTEKEAVRNRFGDCTAAVINEETGQLESMSRINYGYYLNPVVIYLSGLNFLKEGNLGEAVFDFKRLYEIDTKNPIAVQNYVLSMRKAGFEIPEELSKAKVQELSLDDNVVFVIFANGSVAAKKEKLFEIILPTGYYGIAYPVLEQFPTNIQGLSVSFDGTRGELTTVPLADMDAIVAEYLEKEMPVIINRLIASSLVKEGINSVLFAMMIMPTGGSSALIAIKISATVAWVAWNVYKKMVNHTDTRCWQTLPKEFQVLQFKRPKDGIVNIRPISKGVVEYCSASVNLGEGRSPVLLYVMSNGYGSLNINQFNLD